MVASTFPRWKGDTEPRFVFDLATHLSHAVEALVPHAAGAKKKERVGNLTIRRFQYFFPASLQKLCYGGGIVQNMKASTLAKLQVPFLSVAELFALLNDARSADVIHAHWLVPQGVAAAIAKKLLNKKLIITIHGSDVHAYKIHSLEWLLHWSLKQADAITVNSTATQKTILTRFPSVKNKIQIIPMGIDSETLAKAKPKKLSGKVIVFVGRLSEQKGVQYLLEAFPAIQRKVPSAKLVIVGGGPYEKTLKQQAKNMNNVTFTGSLHHSELHAYYKRADVFVLPSISGRGLGKEGFGLAVVEAMAANSPVVATNTGGLTDIIDHNKTGLLVPERNAKELGAAIILLLKNKSKATTLARNAKKFSQEYSWDAIAKKFAKLYT